MKVTSTRIVELEARDVRFPTSRWLDGSDAMHTDPDYSAAYVVLRTDADDGLEGHGLTFTSGRGTEVCVVAARALEPFVVGRTLDGIVADMSGFWRSLVSRSNPRTACSSAWIRFCMILGLEWRIPTAPVSRASITSPAAFATTSNLVRLRLFRSRLRDRSGKVEITDGAAFTIFVCALPNTIRSFTSPNRSIHRLFRMRVRPE